MSGIYIEYPQKRNCLWGLISTKEITHVFKHKKTRFTRNLRELMLLCTKLIAEYCSLDLETPFIDTFSKKHLVVSKY